MAQKYILQCNLLAEFFQIHENPADQNQKHTKNISYNSKRNFLHLSILMEMAQTPLLQRSISPYYFSIQRVHTVK